MVGSRHTKVKSKMAAINPGYVMIKIIVTLLTIKSNVIPLFHVILYKKIWKRGIAIHLAYFFCDQGQKDTDSDYQTIPCNYNLFPPIKDI